MAMHHEKPVAERNAQMPVSSEQLTCLLLNL